MEIWFKAATGCGGDGVGGRTRRHKDDENVERASVDGASTYSLSDGILPSLGARSNRLIVLRPYIISPFLSRYRSWETFLVLLVVYTAWVSPYEFGFLQTPIKGLAIADNIVNGIFAIDIVLTFFVAYLDPQTYLLVDDHKKIAWRYLKTWFILDIVSTVPSELVEKILPQSVQAYGLFNMLRLWRLRRVSKLFSRLEKDRKYSYFWTRCSKLIVRDTIQAASSFALRNRLPVRLQDQMVAHLRLKFRTDSEGLQQQEILDSLPKAIKSSISNYLFYSLLDGVYLFRGVSNDLLFQLVSEMKAEYFPPKEDVILQNEASTDLYVLASGAMDFIIHRNGAEQVVQQVYSGGVCGEIGVLCCRPQLFTVRTRRLCQLLRLNRTVLLNLVQANVGDGTIIMNNFLEHLQEQQNDILMQSVLRDVENMLAHGETDLPLSLCFAATRGDAPLLDHLLRRGSEPNEADMNGRTALHIAAANGNENCAIVLLAYGTDPNIKDSEGNVPLWDAILGRNEALIKLLVDQGATLTSGDVPQYACYAVEQDNLELLKEVVRFGGDVTLPKGNGYTALHAAVPCANPAIVNFLLELGADMDSSDVHGWTPRGLADFHGNEEIKALFRPKEEASAQSVVILSDKETDPTSPKNLEIDSMDVIPRTREVTWADKQPRRRVNTFRNSLFGIMSAASRVEPQTDVGSFSNSMFSGNQPARVILRCPGTGEATKLVFLPETIEELLEIGTKKFGRRTTKVVTSDGAEIDEIELIRDGDQLCLICEKDNMPES